MKKPAPLIETLTRELSWDCPGLWSGKLSAVYERVLTEHSARLSVRIGSSPAAGAPEMSGDYSGLLETLRAPRTSHWEKSAGRALTRSGSLARKGAPPGGTREWRMNGVRQSSYDIACKTPVKMRRHERISWKWASGPYGEIPGELAVGLPDPGKLATGESDGPLVIAAPLAAYLLGRIARGGASGDLLRAVPAAIAFDDEGYPPGADGMLRGRTPLEPWPRRVPGSLHWNLQRPIAAVDSLPVSFVASSFAALEVEEQEFHWALPYFLCRFGKPVAVAGTHLFSGRLDELGDLVKAVGVEHSVYGLAPQCDSPALILRPLSKMKGRRIPFTPQPESDFAIQLAREFIQSLL